jgi:hypothetical protein
MEPAASPENGKPFRAPHPLAAALIERLLTKTQPALSGVEWVLDFASGSGRNGAALEEAGFCVTRIDDATAASRSPFATAGGPYAGAVSTHGLLHGTTAIIAANLRTIAALLTPGGLLYATFGSVHDARFGVGRRVDAATYAPTGGDEAGVAHTFFNRDALTALLQSHFTIESLAERSVDDIVGTSAHSETPLANAVHWFAVATVSETIR